MSATRRKTSPPQIVGEAKTIVPSWFFETCSNPFGVALPRKASQPKMTNPTKPADCKALRESAAWYSLPPDTRTAILAIVEAAQGR